MGTCGRWILKSQQGEQIQLVVAKQPKQQGSQNCCSDMLAQGATAALLHVVSIALLAGLWSATATSMSVMAKLDTPAVLRRSQKQSLSTRVDVLWPHSPCS